MTTSMLLMTLAGVLAAGVVGWIVNGWRLGVQIETIEASFLDMVKLEEKARLDARGLARVLHRHRVTNPTGEGVAFVMDEKVDDMIRPYAGLYWPAMQQELQAARERRRELRLSQR